MGRPFGKGCVWRAPGPGAQPLLRTVIGPVAQEGRPGDSALWVEACTLAELDWDTGQGQFQTHLGADSGGAGPPPTVIVPRKLSDAVSMQRREQV